MKRDFGTQIAAFILQRLGSIMRVSNSSTTKQERKWAS